jgi:MbtH protein
MPGCLTLTGTGRGGTLIALCGQSGLDRIPVGVGRKVIAVRKERSVTNPFEDADASYFVLVNDEGQHSLWPVFADVPDGWQVAFGESGHRECLDFIEGSWTDMRPKSLIKAMDEHAAKERKAAAGNGAKKKKSSTSHAS